MRYALILAFMLSPVIVGCAEEVEHHESDKPRLFGGRTHEESTTYKNPNGTYTTEKSKTKTSD